ncbi:UNVERIFIED_CONTAM: hypothetical protein NCL1_30721 [Trichonephila clavipes]
MKRKEKGWRKIFFLTFKHLYPSMKFEVLSEFSTNRTTSTISLMFDMNSMENTIVLSSKQSVQLKHYLKCTNN